MVNPNKSTAYLKITPVTPVHIGNGEEMSPFVDFVYHDNTVYLIDLKKLNLLEKEDREKLIQNNFQVALSSENEKREEYVLKSFLQSIGRDWKDFVIPSSNIPCISELKTEKIKRCIKTNNSPYIPGSTLKGAIRTAIYYDYYKNNPNGKKLIEELSKTLKDNSRGVQKALKELIKVPPDVGNYIRVNDSHPNQDPDCLVIAPLRREQLAKNKKNNKIPVNCESLNQGSTFYTMFNMQSFKLGMKVNDASQIFKMIKQFSLDNLNRELSQARKINHKPLIESIENLKVRIQLHHETLIRLGQHKSFFYNTFLNLIKPDLFKKYQEKLSIGKNPKTKKIDLSHEFPLTKTMIYEKNNNSVELAGWCKLETVSENEFKTAVHE